MPNGDAALEARVERLERMNRTLLLVLGGVLVAMKLERSPPADKLEALREALARNDVDAGFAVLDELLADTEGTRAPD